MDNVTDVFTPDQGPARRPPVVLGRRWPVATMEGGDAPEQLLAEHGFSVLVTVTKLGRHHRILFDVGTSPDGVVENMRRLDIDPLEIEAIVCSHGHFDHTTGLDGLISADGKSEPSRSDPSAFLAAASRGVAGARPCRDPDDRSTGPYRGRI